MLTPSASITRGTSAFGIKTFKMDFVVSFFPIPGPIITTSAQEIASFKSSVSILSLLYVPKIASGSIV
jgi:hypothetical protein